MKIFVAMASAAIAVTPSSSLSIGHTPSLSTIPTDQWESIVHDSNHQSYSYLLRHDNDENNDTTNSYLTKNQLNTWFQKLHPSSYTNNYADAANDDGGAWTSSSYQNQKLLRQTAWCTLSPNCACEYGYSDTWQPRITHPNMISVLTEITNVITKMCGLKDGELNCVNLNYYPKGGGVGFHADDEFLFDGLRRETRIISLSLCSRDGNVDKDNRTQNDDTDEKNRGVRKFQIKPKSQENIDVQELLLGHGDIMTMEGIFQKYYLHSVWPGDSKEYLDHPLCQGERINLTWRTIVRHLDGSKEECRGIRCPLAEQNQS